MQTPTVAFNVAPTSLAGTVGYLARVKVKRVIPPRGAGMSSLSNTQVKLSSATLESIVATSSTLLPIMDSDIDPQLLSETNVSPVNLRLEQAKANSEKKRKLNGKAASSSNKKLKTKAVGLAVPDSTNTLKYVPPLYFTDI